MEFQQESLSTCDRGRGWSWEKIQVRPGPEVINFFPCSTQLSTKFILLINVKMPTIVGIFTFISIINTTSERLKPRNFFFCRYFSFYEQLKFRALLSWAWKKFYDLGARGSNSIWCWLSDIIRKSFKVSYTLYNWPVRTIVWNNFTVISMYALRSRMKIVWILISWLMRYINSPDISGLNMVGVTSRFHPYTGGYLDRPWENVTKSNRTWLQRQKRLKLTMCYVSGCPGCRTIV